MYVDETEELNTENISVMLEMAKQQAEMFFKLMQNTAYIIKRDLSTDLSELSYLYDVVLML